MEEQYTLDTLNSTLRLIGELWDRLVFVRWTREGLLELAQAIEDALQLVRAVDGQEELAALLFQLDQLMSNSLIAGQLPREAERGQLQGLLRSLNQLSPPADLAADAKTNRSSRILPAGEILLVAEAHSQELIAALQGAGFRVRQLSTLAEVRAMLAQTIPIAAIVDMDCDEGAILAGFNMVAKQDNRVDLKAPIFFISDRGDLVARLEAVSAGGEGYFTKPVDMTLLLEALNDRLRRELLQGRVLIVDDSGKESREMALILESRGLLTQTVDQPMEVIQVLQRFKPDLLLLNMDLREVSGLELAKAIRQHPDFDGLPMILLSSQSDLNRRLAALSAGADDLLGRPLAADNLFKAVSCRLRLRRSLHRKLSRLGQRDTISGLYNRRYFLTQLQRLLAETRNAADGIAVMLITLDNLRAVASIDMTAADAVLEQAAGRLQAVLAPSQQAARFGDAIFAVLDSGSGRQSLLEVAGTMRSALEGDLYRINGDPVQLRVSIGISIAEPGERDVRSLIQQADLACSSAWVAGGDHVQLYHPEANPSVKVSQQKSFLEDIREAVQQQRMNLVFQPIVSMQGDPAERYEVLLRMHKGGHELLPETVFAVTQRHRLGMVLDRWVIAQSIRLLKNRQGRSQPTTLFINISPAVLRDEEFPGWLKGGLEKTAVKPASLVFEMSETAVDKNLAGLRGFLEKVKPLGCGFSLDRFSGSPRAQELVKELAVDYVKLDAHFASDLTEDKHKQQQLKSLVQQLTSQKVTTVAGNIEKLPTLFALWSCGINYVQGFFLQQPHEEMNYDFTSGAF